MSDERKFTVVKSIGDKVQLPQPSIVGSVVACPLCEGTSWKPVTTAGRRGVTRCDCWIAKQAPAGIPREFADVRFENYRVQACNRSAFTAAQMFLATDRDLYLVGRIGCGKTRLACCVLHAFHAKHFAGMFVRVGRALMRLQPDAIDREAFERRLMTEPLIVFDDLGAERDQASDYTRRTLLEIAESRHDDGLRTIWTSNLDLEGLAKHQNDVRLPSRIAGWCVVAEITCDDARVVGAFE